MYFSVFLEKFGILQSFNNCGEHLNLLYRKTQICHKIPLCVVVHCAESIGFPDELGIVLVWFFILGILFIDIIIK